MSLPVYTCGAHVNPNTKKGRAFCCQLPQPAPLRANLMAEANDYVISVGKRLEGYSFGVYHRDDPTKLVFASAPLAKKDWAMQEAGRVVELEIAARNKGHLEK
jgi:hypothetical protein